MNRFQTALQEHDFIIQYKKGSDMPADYLSRHFGLQSEQKVAPTLITKRDQSTFGAYQENVS
jgi:hypothetical protein